MSRPKRIRRVNNPPHYKGFKPIGISQGASSIVFNYEEYEAIRLSDFEMLSQVEAAKIMSVSRPTYARIYERARQKVAQAFVLGKPIVFEGGKVYFDSEWYSCNHCGCWFNHPSKEQDLNHCALCGSSDIEIFSVENQTSINEGVCTCPHCGLEKTAKQLNSCNKEICPDCQQVMIKSRNKSKV